MKDTKKKLEVKGLQDFLAEDESLAEKMTYADYQNKKSAPDNSDRGISEVYETYCTLLEKL